MMGRGLRCSVFYLMTSLLLNNCKLEHMVYCILQIKHKMAIMVVIENKSVCVFKLLKVSQISFDQTTCTPCCVSEQMTHFGFCN